MKDEGVKLDLYNFDQPQHQECPYILTSPRSLQACRTLSIKPVDLLQKSRDEYDAAHANQPLQQRLVAYHTQERLRLKRLRQARELRDRLLVDDERRARAHGRSGGGGRGSAPPDGSTASTSSGLAKGVQQKVDKNKEEEKEEGKEEESQTEEEEGRGGSRHGSSSSNSTAPPLVRHDSESNSSTTSSNTSHFISKSSSKLLKDQENIARSLVTRQSSTSSWEEGGSSNNTRAASVDDDGDVAEAGNRRNSEGQVRIQREEKTGDKKENTDDVQLGDEGEEVVSEEREKDREQGEKPRSTGSISEALGGELYGVSLTSHQVASTSSVTSHQASTSGVISHQVFTSKVPIPSHEVSTHNVTSHHTPIPNVTTNQPSTSGVTSYQLSTSGITSHQPTKPSVTRKPKTGAPRPSSAQRVKQGVHRPGFHPIPKRITPQNRADAKHASIPQEGADNRSLAFSRIPGEPYKVSVASGSRFTPGRSTLPGSATHSQPSPLHQHRQQKSLPRGGHTHTPLLAFKGSRPGTGAVHQLPSTLIPQLPKVCVLLVSMGQVRGQAVFAMLLPLTLGHLTDLESRGHLHLLAITGHAPGGSQHTSPTPLPLPPRRRWRRPKAPSSTLPFIGLNVRRRSSDSTTSVASSLSDATDTHDIIIDPPGTESDDGTRSPNSAAECDRQDDEEDDGALTLHRNSPRKRPSSAYRSEPRLPVVSVVNGGGGTWTPRSDTSTLTPTSTPRLPRRRTPARTPTGPRTPVRRRLPAHRRVSSARPAISTTPASRLPYTGSLDEITGRRGEREASLGVMVGPVSLDLPRPHSAASSLVSSCPTYRISRPSSGLARTQSLRRPASSSSPGAGGTWSPRLLPQQRSVSTVSLADSQILAKFMDGYVGCSQEAAAQWADWRSHVNDKRRQENEENVRRWRRTEELYLQSQENLSHLISSKERRARELLNDQHESRMRRLEERRASELARKAAQEATLKAKEDAEERKRQHLIKMWEQQQNLVDQRRREREEFFKRRVEEGNWAEEEQQDARRKQVEARGEALLEAMKNNMEDRLTRAARNLQFLNDIKEDTLRRQRDERDRRAMAVRVLHHQLEASMMEWRQHVLRRQLDSMAAAEARQEQYLNTRANRIHTDRISRSHHQQQLLQQVMAREEAELQMAKKNLEAKDIKSLEVARERDRQVCRARSTALTTAALRENLRKKLAPETFDKVVARANLELRIENRPPATSTMGTRSHIFLG
ncbi:Coiled-coil domain-containing protein 177-like [Homarus americanus]|uniref:Coiled-coil domain-containing protein 177-like n=1 Tax=Homarus americanus TaxID=6706 RepID=A0A8J5MWK4_HOMAM|nr:Coiled-coil domain-containing protein 177-like [Homarus americanus]